MTADLAEKPITIPYAIHPADQPIPVLGEFYGAGYVAALIPWFDGAQAIVIVADAADGDFGDLEWDPNYEASPGATSFHDGLANSISIDDDQHPAAKACRAYRAGGHEDWHLLAQIPQDAVKVNCQPERTLIDIFKEGAPQAYRKTAYWSSTQSQFYPDCAWVQYFGHGHTGYFDKLIDFGARAGRIVLIRN